MADRTWAAFGLVLGFVVASGCDRANGRHSGEAGVMHVTTDGASDGGLLDVEDDHAGAPGQPGQLTGVGCVVDADCATRLCRDGVCCRESCGGPCRACAGMYTGLENGICGPVKTGSDPHDDCADQTATTQVCAQDGQCDGTGRCRQVPAGQVCAPGSCLDSHTFVSASVCDGAGLCGMGARMDCGPYPCAATGCAQPCTGNPDCAGGTYCSTGSCRAKKVNGEPCGAAFQCATGYCSAEGVCCNATCAGTCMACARLSTGLPDGVCAPTAPGLDPRDDCAQTPAATCGHDGACDGRGACHFFDAGTHCGAGTCAGSTFTPGNLCDGAGACAVGRPAIDCGQSACDPDGCKSACASDTDCSPASYCVLSIQTCGAKQANGERCSAPGECESNACVDGVCCETGCTAKCYACSHDRTGLADGKCQAVKAATDPDNDCETSDPSTCGQDGTCDGNGQCARWRDGTACEAGRCDLQGNYLFSRTCRQGICEAAARDLCGPSVCTATVGCNRICTQNTDCIGATYCDPTNRACVAQKTSGASCQSSAECLLGNCVDGVCCNSPCLGACQSCVARETGQPSDGICANVADGTDPANECGADGSPCGTDGFCGGGKCRFTPSGTSCGAATCVNGPSDSSATLTPASRCDGSGSCVAASPMACPGSVLCLSASACKPTACSAEPDCLENRYCAPGGACVSKKDLGTPCAANKECGNGMCSDNSHGDGVCCASACDLGCQACVQSSTGVATGTCAPRMQNTTMPCGGACPVGYGLCRGGATDPSCQPIVWTFDQGLPPDQNMPYGWGPDSQSGLYYRGGISHTAGGSGSLAILAGIPWHAVPSNVLCANDPSALTATMDLSGKTVTAWVLADSGGGFPGTCSFQIILADGSFFNVGTVTLLGDDQVNVWRPLYATIPAAAAATVYSLGVDCLMTDGWTGTLYLDDVSIR